ncbi:carboxymuconolactone decarboxylase family protein [Aeromicrobium sp. 9AM]|uniref:carboxymuconolactone decarboxylase family protein n=1 Tax=Aeromicrobium sp. 9AM TaxID=2653126 RepID=UPI0012F193DC|nr:carboxymuconolactone decarboxylase family protein [Aeromicrobium sp. 9AM]VXB90181.1 Alkyl hydroperoxide reductase AhpD [Aeromicrobium sp. 9AM]
MQARMSNPAIAVPGALEALRALSTAIEETGLSATTQELVHLRASQINGCSVCLQMHAQALRKMGESDEKIDTVAGWPDAPYFDDAERAALALTEAVTRMSDTSDPVPDDVYEAASAHYDEQQLGALILSIAAINVWNRVNVSTHQVAGAWG